MCSTNATRIQSLFEVARMRTRNLFREVGAHLPSTQWWWSGSSKVLQNCGSCVVMWRRNRKLRWRVPEILLQSRFILKMRVDLTFKGHQNQTAPILESALTTGVVTSTGDEGRILPVQFCEFLKTRCLSCGVVNRL